MMKECLACWEEIEETEDTCPHCGSNQEDVKDYLALVLLKQGKRKISVPKETPVLDYVFETDPAVKEEISLGVVTDIKDKKSPPEPQASSFGIQSDGTYRPTQPSWLAKPEPVKKEVQEAPPTKIEEKEEDKIKTIKCPNCEKEVKFLGHCKFCGQALLRECPSCKQEISSTAKFCTKCGTKVKPLIKKK
ncbi:zinc-ribbon domain-containing protein [Candidatus Heimdallarchaeota archaeon]|nr:MAG: zinc-ribbon domain-containing protein [Candidatus Heimdallarchaeota archaeon]